jgi:hypothetical protein
MKRSEALSKIFDYLDARSIQEISPEEILELVEKIGMVPPKDRPTPTINHISWMAAQGYNADGDIGAGTPYKKGEHKWEKE